MGRILGRRRGLGGTSVVSTSSYTSQKIVVIAREPLDGSFGFVYEEWSGVCWGWTLSASVLSEPLEVSLVVVRFKRSLLLRLRVGVEWEGFPPF